MRKYAQGSISGEDLEVIIQKIGTENILSPDSWFNFLDDNGSFRGKYCLTFDDSLRSQYEIAVPVLDKYNIKAFFFVYSGVLGGDGILFESLRYFVNTNYQKVETFYDEYKALLFENFPYEEFTSLKENLEKTSYLSEYPFYSYLDREYRYIRDCIVSSSHHEYIVTSIMERHGCSPDSIAKKMFMSPDDLNEIINLGHCLGLHSHTHPTNMRRMSYIEQKKEYLTNKKYLEKFSNGEIVCASYPNGSYNDDTLLIMEEMGIESAFKSSFNKDDKTFNRLEIGRVDHVLLDSYL